MQPVRESVSKVEYARRQALEAYGLAAECTDNTVRDAWLKAARMWEELAREYEMLLKNSEAE
jgi:hypothetical protein